MSTNFRFRVTQRSDGNIRQYVLCRGRKSLRRKSDIAIGCSFSAEYFPKVRPRKARTETTIKTLMTATSSVSFNQNCFLSRVLLLYSANKLAVYRNYIYPLLLPVLPFVCLSIIVSCAVTPYYMSDLDDILNTCCL